MQDIRWLALAAAFVAGAVLLPASIAGLVRALRRAYLFAADIAPEREVVFDAPGEVVLHVEGPRFRPNLDYAITSRATGEPVPLRPVVFTRVRGRGRPRVSVRRFTVVSPGAYLVRVSGLSPDVHGGMRLVFTRPHAAAMVGWILGIVLGGQLALGSIVLAIIALAVRR
jgi:hypothetical protein